MKKFFCKLSGWLRLSNTPSLLKWTEWTNNCFSLHLLLPANTIRLLLLLLIWHRIQTKLNSSVSSRIFALVFSYVSCYAHQQQNIVFQLQSIFNLLHLVRSQSSARILTLSLNPPPNSLNVIDIIQLLDLVCSFCGIFFCMQRHLISKKICVFHFTLVFFYIYFS